ncbi:MAG TPA: FAD-binding oxidoreductase [Polyangiaceae bacterium]|jgi:FAD/FMN-containing dehydrogenase|nr:MAG: putative decaprenylphosphoryl-beta-D-ribose oxidase [Deltaproteobacteria bacterium ADurb.Bin207]HNS99558.1 FAD-binding oxidoreductase [Polyangiaceae bacterium]HNZ24242.1 FAD-binding oxidoreductase [Polyangiaceae bacterium]HOD22877.1 FAD-binding oxidoreductase [Polyangiaceae bacterium]HOE50470.1 FAD-binding oxidoreductase [Polyangiaceae bacterium]
MNDVSSHEPIVPSTPEGQVLQQKHGRKVARIAEQLRTRRSTAPLSRQKRTVSHQVPKVHDKKHTDEKIDLLDLDEIIEVDVKRRICIAEPGVPFCKIVEKTLPLGLVPIVVPELKTITVGGAVAGCSIESMSFQYGGFHDTCVEYEIITAQGDTLVCTPDNEHSLVFQMMHGSFGTVGILSRLVFKLIEAKPYVHLRHEKHATIDSYLASIKRHFELQDVAFMDGIIHSNTQLSLCVGDFVDEAPYTNRYDWLKIYYKSTAERIEDYFETPYYFYRYDQGVTNVHPKSFLGRLLIGKFLGSSEVLRIAEKARWLLLDDKRPDVTVDTFLPFSRLKEFLQWYEKDCGHYPLWCVPYRRVHDYEWLTDEFWKGFGDELMVDIAVYGMRQRGDTNYYRLLETKLQELNGVKTLISYNYYPEEEFWSIFHRKNFETVKAKTDPNNIFRNLYEKTCQASMGR